MTTSTTLARPLPSGAPAQPVEQARVLVVVHNPTARRYRGAALEQLLRGELPDFTIHFIETDPETTTLESFSALLDAATVVLASGGDGTVNLVASALVGRATPLAILPAGTANIIAQGLGMPADPLAICQMIRENAAPVLIDMVQVGERYLIHMGGAGYDAHLMTVTNRALKRGFGLGAYILFGARGLFDRPIVDFTIVIDGKTIHERGWMALIANGGEVAVRGVRLGPNISVDDGLLDLVLFTAPNFWDALASFGSIFWGRYRSPYLRYERGRQVEVYTDPPLPVELDGDLIGETPFVAEVIPAALPVLVPTANGGFLGPWLRRFQAMLPAQRQVTG